MTTVQEFVDPARAAPRCNEHMAIGVQPGDHLWTVRLLMLALPAIVTADGQHPVPSSREHASASASSTRRSFSEVGEFAQTQFMTAMLTLPAPLRAGPWQPGRRRQMLGSRRETRRAVRWLQRLRHGRAADESWDSAARLRQVGRGLICGLVYAGARGSIRGHWLPLITHNDDRGRAETVILAPEKRKVGSSILPLTTL